MRLSRRAWLGGDQLDEVHEAIVIRGIDPGIAHENVSMTDRAGGWGTRITSQHWSSIDATVTFAIDLPKTEMKARREVWDAVIAWANRPGQWLRFNTLPNTQLYVDKVVLPGHGDLWDWTADYTITFRACSVPFWQSREETRTTGKTGVAGGNYLIDVEGTTDTVLNVTFKNISGKTIKNFEVSAGGNTLTLNGVNIGANETLEIDHPNSTGLIRIRCTSSSGNRNVYSLLTGSDDLVVSPGGSQKVSYTAERAGIFTATCKGRWL